MYLNALANGTFVDRCSDCPLKVTKKQLESPFDYDEEFAQGFQSVTSECGATGYAYQSRVSCIKCSTMTHAKRLLMGCKG